MTSKRSDAHAGEPTVEKSAMGGGPRTVPDEMGKPWLSEGSENYLRRLLAATV